MNTVDLYAVNIPAIICFSGAVIVGVTAGTCVEVNMGLHGGIISAIIIFSWLGSAFGGALLFRLYYHFRRPRSTRLY